LTAGSTDAPDAVRMTAPAGAQRRRLGRKMRDALLAYAFLLPAMIVFAVFAYYPLYRLFWYATHQQSRFRNRPATWVGAQQLKDTLTSSDFTSGTV